MAYLKNKDTGEVYPVNEFLIARGDMVPCDIHGNVVVAETPAAPKTRKPRAKKEEDPIIEFEGVLNDDLGLGDE